MPRSTRLWAVLAVSCAAALAAATPSGAFASTTGTSAPARTAPAAASPASSSTAAPATADFSGTVALSNCSGSIVRWQASDHALMLTNGHCYDFLGARQVVVNQPAVRNVDLLTSDGTVAGTVSTVTLLYSTMWRTDVALYQLSESYQDLQNEYGTPAFTIADTRPAPKDQPIEVLSGYWRKAYDCNLNGFAYRLHEDVWTWNHSLRYSDGGCQIISGTSGSPVLDADRTMIGINNTINEDGGRCTFDNPCEENRQGKITVHLNRGYGQQTYFLYTCLSGTTLDLSKPGCKLPSP
jgi:V8-like Glu-specific endopeptidase